MPARILAVAQSGRLGGAERALLRLAPLLAERGLELELALPPGGALEEAARGAGLPVHPVALGGIERGRWPRAVLGWPRTRRMARRLRPDLVWLNGIVAHRLAPALRGPPIVPFLHELALSAPRAWRSPRFWGSVPVVLCACEAVAAAAAERGAPADRLRVTYPPVDAVEPAPRPEWAQGGPVVGFVGALEEGKGARDLLRALPRLRASLPEARAVLVGDDGSRSAYARAARAEAEGLGGAATILPPVADARRLMPWFDVLAVPSRIEAFGTVAAEALAAGTPVVAAEVGGLPEYVGRERGGTLVPPADPAALADALAELLPRAPELAAAARAAAEPFAAERSAAAVARALAHALPRHAREPVAP